MQRVPEPELMDEEAQACAYALADFAEPHDHFVALFGEAHPDHCPVSVLDLGCGPADVTLRFARAYPACEVHGVDGAAAMLRFGHEAVAETGLGHRVRLLHGYLPGATLPRTGYDTLISNSLLHHLANPMVLWEAIAQYGAPGAAVFVMDLRRPADVDTARAMMERYAAGEPEVLRQDFFNSLLAAYEPAEVQAQLDAAGLPLKVSVVSDRHLTVSGRLPG